MRSLERFVQLFLAMASVSLPLMAADAHAQVVPLAELEASALSGHPEQGIGAARVLSADAQIDRARAGYLPQLTLGASASLEPGRELLTIRQGGEEYLVSGARALGDSGAFVPQPRAGVTLGLRGSLYDFGRTGSAVDAARAQRTAADAEQRARAEQLVREVRASYVRWAGAHALLALARENLVLAEAREARIAALIEEGARPSIDRASASQQTSSAKLEVEHAEEAVDGARIDLGFSCARELPEGASPEASVLAPSAAAVASEDLRSTALDLAHSAAEARARTLDRARSPVLGYDADTGISAASSHLFPVYSVGVRLSVPLYDGGSADAIAAEARAEAAELAAQARAARVQRDHLSARMKNAKLHAERRVALAEEALRAAETQVTELSTANGLDAEAFTALANAQAARAHAKAELVAAQVAGAYARFGVLP